ncbi:uncharacterized protein [Haliotis asinina]|uniref:uncharacterized protein n=1 Tax=Haliotis asinina TaxID=109174 RepID=UPI003531D1E0
MLVQLSTMLNLFVVLMPAFFLVIAEETQCEWGKYGEHCNLTCPVNCALVPPSTRQHCQKDTGKCSAGCGRGWHGDLCDQSCSTNCPNKTCNQQTGHCTLGCIGHNSGDFCNKCVSGWYGDTCEQPCSRNCLKERCNQTSGVCTLGCNGTSAGEFCNITTVANIKEEADNLTAILVPVVLVAVVVTVGTVVVVLLWRRRRNSAQHANEATVEEMTPLQTGITSEDLLQQKMEEAENVFEKTGIYYTVKKELETHRHVTLCGTAGGGKTTIALKLGKQYKNRGFKVYFVIDVCKLNLTECLTGEDKVCFIFNDIFKTVELPRDTPRVDSILREMEHELETNTGNQREIYVIITANTNNVQGEISQFGETFFGGSSFIDFSLLSHQYSHEEKKDIFNSHLKSSQSGDLLGLNVDAICGFAQSSVGFPQTSKLFFAVENFRKHREKFFREPFRYLREELEAILLQMNDESGALILMFLCKQTLNLREVEMPSDNRHLENMFILIKDVVGITSRTKLAKSIRQFSDTFFTKGDITGFAHPSIYDACACALFTLNPSLVLECCHMKFLRDHVRSDQRLETSTVDESQPTIHVSDVYTAMIEKRRGTADSQSGKNLPKEGVSSDGVMSRDWLDKKVMKTEKVFVKTSIYDRVKETLETHGHVTMSGAAGGGKTAIALMLGKHYEEEQGFLQVHVDEVSKFKLDVYTRELHKKSVCFIFHDIFRIIERSRNITVLKSVLSQLIDLKNETREHKLYTIFTANTYSDHGEISQLGEEGSYFFSDPSLLDFNEMSCQYKPEEKNRIFDELCKGFGTKVDGEKICRFGKSILGFPQTCKLFAGFKSFQTHAEDFFQRPFHYLKEEMNSILKREDNQSAALTLMFLSDGPLNLHQVELPSDSNELEARFTTLKDEVGFTTRTAVAMAVRQFRGSFFTEGDITAFAHPTIYDACATALYKDHRALVLRDASIRFLCEHVYTEETKHTLPETMISVPKDYIKVLTGRLSTLDKENSNYTKLSALIEKLSGNSCDPRND